MENPLSLEERIRRISETDGRQACELLQDEEALLWRIFHAATEPPGRIMPKADLANFFLHHALNVRALAKAALILMNNREPYGVALLARTSLESLFNIRAAFLDKSFGPQRMAFEMEELAGKLTGLIEKKLWPATRHPTPKECKSEAQNIRQRHQISVPSTMAERNRIAKIEQIARTADMTPFYEDEYRQLSLTVHSNQAGILNAVSGFLVQKGMLALCASTLQTSHILTGVFQLKQFYQELDAQEKRFEMLIQQPDFLP
jgi:hypothetical protein